MASAVNDPWTRDWTIVSADLGLAHVMLPLNNFRLENIDPLGKTPKYLVRQCDTSSAQHCFAESVLVPEGSQPASFLEITKRKDMPLFSQETEDQYVEISKIMTTYMERNKGVQRLQGVIKIPCHIPGSDIAPGSPPGHSPRTIEATVHLYQFVNVVKGAKEDLPLLVVRAPLSPACPTNGDGTAIGYGKN